MGRTIEFRLSAQRDRKAAKRSLRKTLRRENTRNLRVVVTDRLESYRGALREMKRAGELGRFVRHRRGRWLNNRVEPDHRRIKRPTPAGVAPMAMLAKGRARVVPANDRPAQRAPAHRAFGLAV